jgi:type IV secretory pathway TraG/TraD family ATPase VirD4
VFPHKSGKGFDLVIPDGISVSGRIVCTEPKSDEAKE